MRRKSISSSITGGPQKHQSKEQKCKSNCVVCNNLTPTAFGAEVYELSKETAFVASKVLDRVRLTKVTKSM